jgi:integrase
MNVAIETAVNKVYYTPKTILFGGGFMGGSIHKDGKSERFYISIYWEGKRYRIFRHPETRDPFYSQKSAEKQLDKIRCEIDEGTFNPKAWFPDSPLSLRIYAKNWLKSLNISKNTFRWYRSAVNNYIIVFFGDKDIRKIRYNDIVAFQRWIPLSSKGIYNTINVLKKLLRDAWRNEDIPKVPPFPVISYTTPEIEYLTIEQQDKIIIAIPERDRPIFQFMMEYGVRPQEARALQRDCIKNGQIIIKRVFSDNTLKETTKTGDKGKRSLPITPYFNEVLKSIDKQTKLSPFVFVRWDGKPYSSYNLNAIWHEAENKTGIKCKLYNACRHSLGCQLLDQGEDMDLVRQVLGHTDARMTLKYAKRKITGLTSALHKRRSIKVIELKKDKDNDRQ